MRKDEGPSNPVWKGVTTELRMVATGVPKPVLLNYVANRRGKFLFLESL
jgi:hypothetical protein